MVGRAKRTSNGKSTGKVEKVKKVDDVEKQIAEHYDSKYFSIGYDKFKDRTYLNVQLELISSYTLLSIPEKFSWHFITSYPGKGVSNILDSRGLCATSSSKSWRFLKNRSLLLLTGNGRINLGEGRLDAEILTSRSAAGVSEVLCWTLEEQQFNALLDATDVEFQLGGIESSIEPARLRLLEFYKKLLDPNTIPLNRKPETTATISDAKGKRRVFVATSDKSSEYEIIKELRAKKFELVDDRKAADLIVEFGVERTDEIVLLGTVLERKWGKMTVYLVMDGVEVQIFVKNSKNGFLYKQAEGSIEDFVGKLLKTEKSK